jgi:tetratricopeptide repeat protein 21B
VDPTNEEASFMVANLMLLKDQTDGAISTFINMLEKKPDNFIALSQLIQLMRKAGKLEEAKKYIDNAEKNISKSTDAGLGYIKGLYYKFTGEP